MAKTLSQLDQALVYHENLPDRIRRYLNGRGIPDETIGRFMLGWNGRRITIPVYDREGEVTSFRFAKDPEDDGPGPKMLSTRGSRAELYGWERLVRSSPMRVIICEGEFDRLVLESHGFAAVTSTAGAGVFKKRWAEALRLVSDVYVCFDRDDAGRKGALRVARMIPGARICELPPEVGEGGDVTDFFVRLGKGYEDFLEVLRTAERPPEESRRPGRPSSPDSHGEPSSEHTDAAELKARIPLERVVARRLKLERRGRDYRALCPFHDEKTPSFVVFPETGTYHCFGCGAHGDAIDFLMQLDGLGFRDALDALRRSV